VEHEHAQQEGDSRVEVGDDSGSQRADFADQREEEQEADRRADHRERQDRQQHVDGRHRVRELRYREGGIEERGQHE
jgi:hypothetical protein